MGAQAFDQGIRIHTFDRFFAGRIDGRDKDNIGVVKGVLKIVHQVPQASKTVRLNHRNDPLLRSLAGCR